eukprot:361612-Chlamydomonas_euryale.AAC.1
MVRSSTAAVVALGATGAAAALGLGLAVVLSLHARGGGGGGGTSRAGSGRSGGPSSSLGRALSRMVTRRPASFYEALPLVKLINPAGMQEGLYDHMVNKRAAGWPFSDAANQMAGCAAMQPVRWLAVQPCSHALWRPSSRVAIGWAAVQPCRWAAAQPCSWAAMQACRCAAVQACG